MTTVPEAPNGSVAVVVAGGSARRMGGVDKLALEVAGRPILDHVLAAARPLCSTLVVVGPPRPTEIEGVVFAAEAEPGGGPVPAVAAAMEEVAAGLAATGGEGAVAVLAGDLPLLATADLELLFAAVADASVEAAAAVDDRGRPHPLLAVHRVAGLRDRMAHLGADLSGVPAARLLPADTVLVGLGPASTLNVNCPADLDRARTLIGGRR